MDCLLRKDEQPQCTWQALGPLNFVNSVLVLVCSFRIYRTQSLNLFKSVSSSILQDLEPPAWWQHPFTTCPRWWNHTRHTVMCGENAGAVFWPLMGCTVSEATFCPLLSPKFTSAFAPQSCSATNRPILSHAIQIFNRLSKARPSASCFIPGRSWQLLLFWLIKNAQSDMFTPICTHWCAKGPWEK